MNMYAENEDYRRAATKHLSGATCIHCDAIGVLRPAAGGRRFLEMHHEDGCPVRIAEEQSDVGA